MLSNIVNKLNNRYILAVMVALFLWGFVRQIRK